MFGTTPVLGKRDSSVGVATDYGLDDRGSTPCRSKSFLLLRSVQTGSGVHPASYAMRIVGSFQGGKAAGA
jgi:hypothetical protein